ncbi:MAG: inositol monophosphatase family protein [Methylobacillus sp.]|jgi:myo-inositol-1(or 4)-monophosphatase|nr:inositol monophosphatase family protein [Methylobacillus sp.]
MDSAGLIPSLTDLVAVVKRIGDEVVLPHFTRVGYTRKADGSVLTEVDLQAQEALREALTNIADCPLLGEEMTAEEQMRQWEAGRDGLWCVDPVDGTSNFVSGIPYFAVSVAWMWRGKPLLGVIYAPAVKEMFSAQAGQGAWLNGKKLPLSAPASTLTEAIAGIDFKRLSLPLAAKLVGAPPYHSQRNLGSCALDWCYVASGQFDLYLHGGQYLWDYAAGCLILQEAGGTMSTLFSPDFWEGDVRRKSVVAASNDFLWKEWRAAIGEVGSQ